MSDSQNNMIPDLSVPDPTSHNNMILSSLMDHQDPLNYAWAFSTCAEFCQEFGIRNKKLLESVFEKIKALGEGENNPQIFQRLYNHATTPVFIKKIILFPEFKQYLKTHNADHCLLLLAKRLEACERYKTQLAHILVLFKSCPTEACLALVRFTHSVEALPQGEEKIQLNWLLEQTRQAWYQENYLVSHALASPFLQTYLNTNPQWAPCVDFVLTLIKQHAILSPNHWNDILSLTHYNPALFCAALSESYLINQLDLCLLKPFLTTHPENLEDFLNLTQHHKGRFTAWAEWVALQPEQAAIVFTYWQNHLVHLTNESDCQETALHTLLSAKKSGILTLNPDNDLAFEKLIQAYLALKETNLTNRDKDKLPETKRHLLTEMLLLGTVKTTCWVLGACIYMPTLYYQVYKQKFASKPVIPLTPSTRFDQAFYGMYALVGHPFTGNRIFEYTAQDSFKKTFLNGFRLFTNPEVGEQYFHHINNPKISDAEFYKRVLAKP